MICLQCRRLGSNPSLARSPGERNGYPLQYSCLENSMDREAWQATDTIERLSLSFAFSHYMQLGLSKYFVDQIIVDFGN